MFWGIKMFDFDSYLIPLQLLLLFIYFFAFILTCLQSKITISEIFYSKTKGLGDAL